MRYSSGSVRAPFQFDRLRWKSPLWKGCPLFSCELRRPLFLLVGLLIAHVLSVNAAAQVTVSHVTPPANHEVKCIRYADLNEMDVSKGMELRPWDEIFCRTGKAIVELKSGPGSTFKASGPFRVVIMPTEGRALCVNVLNGDGDMQSDYPSNMSTGETNMGPERTEYAIRVKRTEQGLSREYSVYDGDVKISSPAFDTSIATGQKLVMRPLEPPEALRLASEDITRVVNLYAYVDVTKAGISAAAQVEPDRLLERFKVLYRSVFSDPKNALKRADLAVEQVNSGISSSAIYQLKKAEEYTPPGDTMQLVRIAVLKGIALKEIGSFGEANEQFRKAIRIDPEALSESNLREYKLKSSTIEQIRPQKRVVQSPRDLQNNLLRLIDEKRPDLAITGFLNRLNVADTNSRDHYGLALAYSSNGESGLAGKHAARAIELNDQDSQLTADETATLRRILKPEKLQTPPEPSKPPRRSSEKSAASWPVPQAATKEQAYLFSLIAQQRFDEALAGFEKLPKDSILYYGIAAIYYERNRFDVASSLASKAIESTKQDGLLSKDAYAACTRIIQAGTKR
jgi:tetratricopeptide (TPR) repeat protein